MKQLSLRWKALIPVVGAIVVLAAVIFVVSQGIITKQAEGLDITKVQSGSGVDVRTFRSGVPWAMAGRRARSAL